MKKIEHNLENILDGLACLKKKEFLNEGLHGLEKESLRIDEKGNLAMTSHPKSLGNSLTDPHITTDFSESQMVGNSSPEALEGARPFQTWSTKPTKRPVPAKRLPRFKAKWGVGTASSLDLK